MLLYYLLVFNVVHTFVIYDFMRLLYGKKYRTPWVYAGGCLVFYILDNLVNQCYNSIFNVLFECVAVQVFSKLLFCDHPRKLQYNFFFFLYYILLDIFISVAFTLPEQLNFSWQMQQNIALRFFANFFVLACTYRFVVHMLKDTYRVFSINQSRFLHLFMLWQLFVLLHFICEEDQYAPIVLFFFLASFLMLDFCIIALFSYTKQMQSVKERARMYQQQANLLQQNMRSINDKNKEMLQMAHDLRSHLQVAENLRDPAYLEALENKIQVLTEKVHTGNRILDVILNNAMIAAHDRDIRFSCQSEKLRFDFIKELDITTIFSNLLNNAMEACEMQVAGKKEIQVLFYEKNVHLMIRISNTYNAKCVQRHGTMFCTTKKRHSGIGLSNVRRTVERYDGDMQICLEDGYFIVQIAMPIPETVFS